MNVSIKFLYNRLIHINQCSLTYSEFVATNLQNKTALLIQYRKFREWYQLCFCIFSLWYLAYPYYNVTYGLAISSFSAVGDTELLYTHTHTHLRQECWHTIALRTVTYFDVEAMVAITCLVVDMLKERNKKNILSENRLERYIAEISCLERYFWKTSNPFLLYPMIIH